MIVVVDGSDKATGPVVLEEHEDLRSLSVELRGCGRDEAPALLGDMGRIDGDHVWLRIDRLRELSPQRDLGTWLDGFEASMLYAKSKGWTDESGDYVRAHL